MSLPVYAQVMASTSKKQASLWVALAVATLALGLVHLQALGDDVEACMLEDVTATPTVQSPLSSTSEELEQRCAALSKEFMSFQKDLPKSGLEALPIAARLLQDLRSFDMQYTLTMSMPVSKQPYEPPNATDQNTTSNPETLAERKLKRTATSVCFLKLVTEARRLTASLPREGGNANGALGCTVGVLQGIEKKALKDLEWEESPSALSSVAMYWSVLSVSDRSSAPLFGAGPMPAGKGSLAWVQDAWGTLAPADMVLAEELLSENVHGSSRQRRSLSLAHAHRLKEHAKALESHDQHHAAARRYKTMAKLAEEGGSAPLSAYALSQLSHSLKMHGSQEEALAAAKNAVDLTMDPLAQFVLATVRLSSGHLTTEASMKVAEGQLRAVAGQLPTEDMEMQRAKMHNEMRMWHWISKGDVNRCLWTGDAARFLICSMCKFIF